MNNCTMRLHPEWPDVVFRDDESLLSPSRRDKVRLLAQSTFASFSKDVRIFAAACYVTPRRSYLPIMSAWETSTFVPSATRSIVCKKMQSEKTSRWWRVVVSERKGRMER